MGSAELAVWVCREEKRVSGLTRDTTCGDVVRALLQEAGGGALTGPARSYCIVEKWRGLERALPNGTRMLRLWSAWGHEQRNVRFVLVRSEAALSSNGPRSAEARVVQSKERRGAEPERGEPAVEISQEKRRRVVRKAFRKLEKTKQKKEENCAEKMETLVHLVLSQDHTIRQQTQRIHELDGEIERHEATVHTDRMRQHGANYVQDTYLAAADPESGAGAELCARYDEYARLHEELAEHQALLEKLTGEVQEELDQRWMLRRQEAELVGVEEPELLSESDAPQEEALRIRTQLDTSSYIGLRIHTDLEDIRTQLELSLGIWEAKEHELGDLLKNLDSLNIAEEDGPGFDRDLQTSTEEQSNVWVEQARGLSKSSAGGNDDDSDTGLSSMHSQDSDTPAVCESLV